MKILLLGASALLFTSGCGTMSAAYPLDEGEHRMGVTFGGPFTTTLGPPIPVPNLIVERRSGLAPVQEMPLDVNYGINLTSIAFGQAGVHTGASLHLFKGEGWIPSMSLTERIHVYSNHFDTTKPAETRLPWGLNEADFTLSWALGNHFVYGGASNVVDFADPELLVSPFAGVEFYPNGKSLGIQLEARLHGANFSPDIWDVTWLNVGEEPGWGMLAVTAGVSWTPGGEKK
jgi:hypothetical protein